MSAVDAKPREGSEGFDPGPNGDEWWSSIPTHPLPTDDPWHIGDLFGTTPGGGDALMNGVSPPSVGASAGGTVTSTANAFSWLLD